MTLIEIIDTFTFYGVDVILLAAATAVIVQISKLTFLKKVQKKLITFAPFGVGILLYAAYADVRNMNFFYVFLNYTEIIEHGISVGAVATLLYVLYEQFVREKTGLSATEKVVSTLIEGFVPSANVESVAALITEAIEKDVTGNGAKRAAEILAENSGEGVTERDIELLARLIIETLAHLSATS